MGQEGEDWSLQPVSPSVHALFPNDVGISVSDLIHLPIYRERVLDGAADIDMTPLHAPDASFSLSVPMPVFEFDRGPSFSKPA